MLEAVAPWVALAVFAGGLLVRISGWFRRSLGADGIATSDRLRQAARGIVASPFGRDGRRLGAAFFWDVLLQRRILKQSVPRWLAHLGLSAGVLLLVLLHALGRPLMARIFPAWQPTLDPYRLLRDLLGAVLLAGLLLAACRRYLVDVPRRVTTRADSYALGILAVVVVSGILLEATQLTSYAKFRAMAEQYGGGEGERPALEAYWAREMGTAVPGGGARDPAVVARGAAIHAGSCAACHAPARSAFLSYGASVLLRPVSPGLDRVDAAGVLWALHFLATLIGLAILPFTKLFHLVATPISLLANAVLRGGGGHPANLATKRMIELDACTHCCSCSARCSVAPASDVLGNAVVLPSEKMVALRRLAAGAALAPAQLSALQEGVSLCTTCERCSVACPSGIDLPGLWGAARDALLARGEPAYALLSPLSARAVAAEPADAAARREAAARAERALEAQFSAADASAPVTPADGALLASMRRSVQASTYSLCFGCKACTTGCPVVRAQPDPQAALGLLPHQVLYATRLQLWDVVLGSRMLWSCLGCYQCQQFCPQGVAITDVLYELKNAAIAHASARDAVMRTAS